MSCTQVRSATAGSPAASATSAVNLLTASSCWAGPSAPHEVDRIRNGSVHAPKWQAVYQELVLVEHLAPDIEVAIVERQVTAGDEGALSMGTG